MPKPSDSECIRNTLSGRREAFRPLIERYLPKVAAFLKPLMRNEFTREDLCQETFLRAYEKLGTFDLARPFGPWILRIAFHLAVRKHQQPGPGEIPLWEEADNWHPELSYQKDPADRVWVDYLLERLPPGIRLLFLLKYSLELTYEEMAQVFEEPAAAIKTRLHRACLRLRASLEDQDTSPKNQNPTEKGEG